AFFLLFLSFWLRNSFFLGIFLNFRLRNSFFLCIFCVSIFFGSCIFIFAAVLCCSRNCLLLCVLLCCLALILSSFSSLRSLFFCSTGNFLCICLLCRSLSCGSLCCCFFLFLDLLEFCILLFDQLLILLSLGLCG